MKLKSNILGKSLMLTLTALMITACGGLSADSAKDKLLAVDDFGFEVQVDSSPDQLSISDVFEGECDELDTLNTSYSKANIVASSEFEERSDTQNGYSLGEYVFQFPSSDEASKFLSDAKEVASNSDCEWYYSSRTQGANGSAIGYGSEDFENVRDLKTAFKVDAKDSVVWDVNSNTIISGTFLSTSSSEEGGIAIAQSNDLIVFIQYSVQADEISDASEPVTRRNLEEIVGKAFNKMLG